MFWRTLLGPLASRLPALLFALLAPLQAAALPQVSIYTYPGYVQAGQTTVIGINLSDDRYQLLNASISLWDFSASGFQATGLNISNGCGGTLTFPSNTSISISGVNWAYIYPPCTVSFEVTYVGAGSSATVTFPSGLLLNPGSGTNPLPASATICIIPPTVVTTTADSGPGSLRAAISAVNTNGCAGQYNIDFNITASPPPWKIALASDLPALVPSSGSTVYFNANNAATGSPPSVVLDGSACARGCSIGLQTNESVYLHNVAIGGFKTAGVLVATGYTNLQDSYLGTDASGTARKRNGVGLDVAAGAGSGSLGSGVIIWNTIGARSAGGSLNISQAGIGVDVNGNVAGNGIGVLASAGSASVYSCTLRGNTGPGMALTGTSTGNMSNTIAYGNGGPALDLDNDGVTPNNYITPGPLAGVPNGLLNYPQFTARYDGVNTIVTGALKTTPGGIYEVDVFENSVPRTVATGGETRLVRLSVRPDANGDAPITFTFAGLHDNISMQTFVCSEGCYNPSEYSPSVRTQLPGPGVGISPTALDFGTRSLGTRSTPQSVVLLNNGTADLTVRNMTITGDYSFSSDCPITTPLAAGQSCVITVVFAPLVEGARPGVLTIETGDPGSPRSVPLSGAGVIVQVGTLSVDPPAVDLGVVSLGSTSTPQLVRVSNTGNLGVTMSWSTAAPFSVVAVPPPAAECGAALGPGESCNVAVAFTPAFAGGVPGSLVFTSDASNPVLTVPLTGQGISGPPPRALSLPAAIDFGGVPFGLRSDGQSITVKNVSRGAVTVTDVSTAGDFSLVDDCAGLPPGATCTITAYFRPSARGPRTGTIALRAAGDPDPYFVTLTGIGTANLQPLLSVSPLRLAFGNALIGPPGAASIVQLTNIGEVPLGLSPVLSRGDFLVTDRCGASLAPGDHCDVEVRFYPRETGLRTATMGIESSAGNGPHRVELSGVGCAIPNTARSRLAPLVCSK